MAEAYDFVIVGGGTAGLIVARRLSENPNFHVLVLEAGGDHINDPRITNPGLWITIIDDPEFDWKLLSTPQAGQNSSSLPPFCGQLHLTSI